MPTKKKPAPKKATKPAKKTAVKKPVAKKTAPKKATNKHSKPAIKKPVHHTVSKAAKPARPVGGKPVAKPAKPIAKPAAHVPAKKTEPLKKSLVSVKPLIKQIVKKEPPKP